VGLTLPWNGRDSAVSTVPGGSATTIAWALRRRSSMAILRIGMFSAAFDAR